MNLPPGKFGLPIIGQTLQFLFDRKFVDKQYAKYGAISKTSILGRPTVYMIGSEAAEFLLSSHMECFSWKEGWPDSFKILLGESLFLQDGEEHRRNRRLMMPAFHGQALNGYFSTMSEISQQYLHKWEAKGEFNWFDEFKQLTFEIASQLLIGAKAGDDVERLSKLFSTLTNGFFSIVPFALPFTALGKAIAARDLLLQHITQVVQQRQQNPTNDVLSMLAQARDEDGGRFSLEELKAQAMLMLFAGHETTTSMLTWFCLELGRHPEVLELARQEQRELAHLGQLNLDQLGKMPYLDQIFQEIERLRPPVAGGFRGVIKPFEFQGYHVPKGWLAIYSIMVTHKQANIYPNPDQFDPDRFSPDRQEHKQKPFSLIGFGGGARICVGLAFAKLEMKIIAANLLRNYQWEILPSQNLEPFPIPTLRPKDGLKVKFYPLTKQA
ncbi:cytochrome P450 [Pseudanabaena sp. 'Roaring Creek']|uniref:cytochrome P450 n=1 Tax=Pseudanabaena sp. 'Roaring Creek' TaxID=1681830 RepID=UPI0006D81467|nr:cytochrome P450 [Pseudanabaena sp. 'Roaring Creek']